MAAVQRNGNDRGLQTMTIADNLDHLVEEKKTINIFESDNYFGATVGKKVDGTQLKTAIKKIHKIAQSLQADSITYHYKK